VEQIQRRIIQMKVRTIGIDLGKTACHVVGFDEPGIRMDPQRHGGGHNASSENGKHG
jgi:hypothetical protein